MDLSIIIVNYKVPKLLQQCLHSIYNTLSSSNLQYEIWVIDNASEDESPQLISKNFPNVNLIANTSNVGFARANNQAIRKAKGKYILLLNPDTIIHPNAIEILYNFLEKDSDTGAVGGKGLYPNGTIQAGFRRSIPTLEVAFYHFSGLSKLFPKSSHFARYNMSYLDEDLEHEVECLSGCFMMIRKSVLEQIGLMSEIYFMYGEDIDLCYRISQANYKLYYVPSAIITHYHKQSSKKNQIQSTKAFYNAMIYFYDKFFHKRYGIYLNNLIYIMINLLGGFKLLQSIIMELLYIRQS